jgi:hypothetical protein
VSYLTDEYKILQDKIDKIGAFRITIKGWSVTATIAGLAAISSGKILPPTVIALAIDVLLAFFFYFEREQVSLGSGFNGRARLIEIQIDKLRRASHGGVLTFSTPNIARSSSSKKSKDLIKLSFRKYPNLEKYRIGINEQFRLAIKSDVIFYLAMGIAAWLPGWSTITDKPQSKPTVVLQTIQRSNQVPSHMPLQQEKGVSIQVSTK